MKTLDGRPTTLGRLLGPVRPTVVSFWATWCAPCALEGRRLAKLRTAYADERLAIVGINIDSKADAARLDQFRQKAQMNYTQALDGQAAYRAMAARDQFALPRTYVFGAGGEPVAAFGRFFGERTLSASDAAVRSAVDCSAQPQVIALRPMARAQAARGAFMPNAMQGVYHVQ
jgi:thiol-disulfide isomerase/thioredoxin